MSILDILKHKSAADSAIPGLDITPQSLILINLKKKKTQYHISHYAHTALQPQALVNDVVQNSTLFAESLQQIKTLSNLNSSQTCIATPSSLLMSKHIKLNPELPAHEQEAAAWREAKSSFAHFSQDLLLDFSWLDKDKHRALLTAARKGPIEARIATLRSAKLAPQIIDIDYLALQRGFSLITDQVPEAFHKKPIALVHMDEQSLLIAVVHQQQLVTTFYQRYHGEALAHAIQTCLGFEHPSPTNTNDATVDLHLPALQIKYALHHLLAKTPMTFSGIVLSGSVALLEGIDQAVREATQLDTHIADPISTMELHPDLNQTLLKQRSPTTLIACGLALRGYV